MASNPERFDCVSAGAKTLADLAQSRRPRGIRGREILPAISQMSAHAFVITPAGPFAICRRRIESRPFEGMP
jgi:hypothetical protein